MGTATPQPAAEKFGFWTRIWNRVRPHLEAEVVSISVLVILSAGLLATFWLFKFLRSQGIDNSVMDTLDEVHHIATIIVFVMFFVGIVRHSLTLTTKAKDD